MIRQLQLENELLRIKLSHVFNYLGLDDQKFYDPQWKSKNKIKDKRMSAQLVEIKNNSVDIYGEKLKRKFILSPSFKINLDQNRDLNNQSWHSEHYEYHAKRVGHSAKNSGEFESFKPSSKEISISHSKPDKRSFLASQDKIKFNVLNDVQNQSWQITEHNDDTEEFSCNVVHVDNQNEDSNAKHRSSQCSILNQTNKVYLTTDLDSKRLKNCISQNKENHDDFWPLKEVRSGFRSFSNNTPLNGLNTHRNLDGVTLYSKIKIKDRSKSRKKWFD